MEQLVNEKGKAGAEEVIKFLQDLQDPEACKKLPDTIVLFAHPATEDVLGEIHLFGSTSHEDLLSLLKHTYRTMLKQAESELEGGETTAEKLH